MKTNLFRLVDEEGNVYWGRIFALIIVASFVILAASFVVRYMVLANNWAEEPAELLSPDNVKKEYEWFYTSQKSLTATKANIDALESKQQDMIFLNGEDTSRWPISTRDEYKQVGQQILQLETAYNQACGEYQAKWDNVFHNIVAPRDIPRSCEFTQ